MRRVTVRYHQEEDAWWAETDDLKTFSAAGGTYEEVRGRVCIALADLLGDDIDLYEDLSAVGAEVGYWLRGESAIPGFQVQSVLGLSGTSATRGSISVGVGPVLPNVTGQSGNQRVEIS